VSAYKLSISQPLIPGPLVFSSLVPFTHCLLPIACFFHDAGRVHKTARFGGRNRPLAFVFPGGGGTRIAADDVSFKHFFTRHGALYCNTLVGLPTAGLGAGF